MEVSETTPADAPTTSAETRQPARPSHERPSAAKRIAAGLAFDKIGAIYVWAGIAVVFAIWVPDQFLTSDTAKQILNANALTALAALSITIPLAARVFDLSFAFT